MFSIMYSAITYVIQLSPRRQEEVGESDRREPFAQRRGRSLLESARHGSLAVADDCRAPAGAAVRRQDEHRVARALRTALVGALAASARVYCTRSRAARELIQRAACSATAKTCASSSILELCLYQSLSFSRIHEAYFLSLYGQVISLICTVWLPWSNHRAHLPFSLCFIVS